MNQLIISAATEGATSPLMPNVWEMGVVLVGFAVLMYIVVKFIVPMFEKTFRRACRGHRRWHRQS